MRPFDVKHDDPVPLARTAAIRSSAEQDPEPRRALRALPPAERLRIAFRLARTATGIRRDQ